MKYLLALIVALNLTGCASIFSNKKQDFPAVDPAFTAECPVLDKVPDGTTSLSELEKVVSGNYTKYYQCSNKVDAWNKWYTDQKKIYDGVK